MEYRFTHWINTGKDRAIRIETNDGEKRYVVILRNDGLNVAYGNGKSVESAFNNAMCNYHNVG
jgi:hypothetical protein